MPQRSAFALFCDDIREETSGKHTLVGLFGDFMTITSPTGKPPVAVPKLVVRCVVRAYQDDPVKNVLFRISGPPIGQPREDRFENIDWSRADPKLGRWQVVLDIVFTPLVIREPGPIVAEAVVDGEVLQAGGLQVIFAAQGAANS